MQNQLQTYHLAIPPLANRKGLFNSKTKGLKIVRREIKWSGE